MRSPSYTRAAATVLALALGAMPLVVAPAAAKPSDKARHTAFNLFAVPIAILQVNNVFCPVSNRGKVCVNRNDNPALEGGFWPNGTPDSYIYNSGLQIGGVIPNSPFTGGTADTVGVYFMDPRGSQFEGEGLTNVFNSANTDDAAAWPNGAIARDTALYNPVLLGRNVVSQQDVWVRVWDGNPANSISGSHPLGIVVDERGMAWNYPTGNEDIIYFVYTVYNVSASNPAKYQNATIDPLLRSEIAAIGVRFKALNDQRYGINIPADGYDIGSTFLAFFEDCDVGVNSASNYATANFVFNLSFCYKSDFNDPPPDFTYPPDIFSPPLFAGVGFTGVKYLRSPLDNGGKELGLTLFSNTGNPTSSGGAGYVDSRGGKQLYRYLSGTSSPAAGDNSCTSQGQQLALRYCFLFQQPVDARFFMSSGPFTLPAGESRTIVVAYVQAGALQSAMTGPCAPGPGKNCQSSPPPSPEDLYTGADTIRTIDKIAGWVSATPALGDTNHRIDQNEVKTVPRTLFNKSLVAQTVFDNKFLLPFSPEQPQFFLIPGDSSVTVVWRPSVTETTGDPYFLVASDPTSLLYDPNFRQFDVEGYRVYRGRSASSMELIAQFDYAGTEIKDFIGGMAYPGNCAPELGVTTDCPAAFPINFQPGISPAVNPAEHADQVLAGNVVQVKLSRSPRVQKINGDILILASDTAVSGGGTNGSCRPSACLPLTDNAVPFAFVDHNVRNHFTYIYAVTAFDLNSLQSGPSSLESPRTTLKTATPRPSAGQETAGSLKAPVLVGGNGQVLNPNAPVPAIDAATGEFAGPMPPSNGLHLGLAAFIPEVLTSGTITLTVDSVVPGSALIGPVAARYYVTGKGSGAPTSVVIPIFVDAFDADSSASVPFPATPVITSKGGRFGGDSTFGLSGSASITVPGTWHTASWGRGSANTPAGDPFSDENGPRWWSGTPNENTPTPNSKVCVPAVGGCVQADLSLNAGSLPGVDNIFHVQGYSTVPSVPQRNLEGISATVYRAADFRIKWGAAGAIDSVRDVTHNLPVAFSAKIRASWGILNDSSFVGAGSTPDGNNALLTWTDIFCVDPAPAYLGSCATTVPLMNHARSTPIAVTASAFATPPGAANGSGFIFYINGHFFLMKLTGGALPAAGTVWNVRFYSGKVTGSAGSYAFEGATRPPAVPGLQQQIAYEGTTFDSTATNDSVLAKAHTVPDPYYVTNALEISPNIKVLKFVHLPARCIIRIYSTSAVLVRVLTHDDPTNGSEESWNLRNRNNQFVASGVYFYHIEAPDGKTKVGRFTIVNFAP